jgi:hypothetical protein
MGGYFRGVKCNFPKSLISKQFAMLTFNLNVRMPTSSWRGIRSNKDEASQIAQTLKADTLQAKGKHQEEVHQTSKS